MPLFKNLLTRPVSLFGSPRSLPGPYSPGPFVYPLDHFNATKVSPRFSNTTFRQATPHFRPIERIGGFRVRLERTTVEHSPTMLGQSRNEHVIVEMGFTLSIHPVSESNHRPPASALIERLSL